MLNVEPAHASFGRVRVHGDMIRVRLQNSRVNGYTGAAGATAVLVMLKPRLCLACLLRTLNTIDWLALAVHAPLDDQHLKP